MNKENRDRKTERKARKREKHRDVISEPSLHLLYPRIPSSKERKRGAGLCFALNTLSEVSL